MPQPLSPWTDRLRQILNEGPVTWDRAVAQMASAVPPGRAYRRGLKFAERSRSVLSRDEVIRIGARQIVQTSINSFHRRGVVTFEERDGQRWIVLGPKPIRVPGARKRNLRGGPKGRPLSPYGQLLRERIEAGESDWDELVDAAVPLVPYQVKRKRYAVERSLTQFEAFGRIIIDKTPEGRVVRLGPKAWPS